MNMKIRHYFHIVLFVYFLLINIIALSQNSKSFFKPQSFTISANGNGMWEIEDGFGGQWMDFLRVRGQLFFENNLSLVIENKTRIYNNAKSQNDWSQLFLQYSNIVSHNVKFPLFKFPTLVNFKAGKLEWYPTFRDPRLIAENIDLFTNPNSFYGLSGDIFMPLLKNRNLSLRISGHSGDIIENNIKAEILNLYLSYNQILYKNFGFAAQLGQMQGSRHFVNYAYLYYRPKIEELELGFKGGKLASLDAIPYGFEITIEREFKYFAIGAYYQRRINQKSHFDEYQSNSQIFGFTWRIIGPPKLKSIFDTYQFIYDSNTKTIRFVIPILLGDFYFN